MSGSLVLTQNRTYICNNFKLAKKQDILVSALWGQDFAVSITPQRRIYNLTLKIINYRI